MHLQASSTDNLPSLRRRSPARVSAGPDPIATRPRDALIAACRTSVNLPPSPELGHQEMRTKERRELVGTHSVMQWPVHATPPSGLCDSVPALVSANQINSGPVSAD